MDEARRTAMRFLRFLGRRWWVLVLVTAGLGWAVKRYADALPRTYGNAPAVVELVQDPPRNASSFDSYEYAAATMAYTVVPTQQAVLQTSEVLDPVVKSLGLEADPSYGSLAGRVVTSASPNTSLLSIVVHGPVPETNAAAANEIARVYQGLRQKEREKYLSDLIAGADRQVESRRADLRAAEEAAQAWREKNRLLNVEASEETARTRFSSQWTAKKRAEAERDEAERSEQQVLAAERDGRDVGDVGPVRDDPRVREAVAELRRLEQHAEQLALTLPEQSDRADLLQARRRAEEQRQAVARLQKARAEDVKVAAAAARRDVERLAADYAQEEAELNRIVGLGLEWSRLRTTQTRLERDLAEALAESRLYADLKASQREPVRIRQWAQPSTAIVSPRLSVIYAGGGILALVLAIGVALLLDLFSTRLRDPEEIQRIAGAPFLGVVPLFKAGKGEASPSRLVLEELDGDASEAYRMIAATALLHGGDGEPPKTLLVTSPQAGDGKTTTATGLAMALARRGGRVLLVDADLRKPDLHHVLGAPIEPGLTLLFSAGRSAWDAVRTVEVSADRHETVRFDVLTAGVLPPSPADLLSGPRMQAFLREARRRYDAVVIDSPPVNLVTDACLLAPYVDGLVLVIRDARTHRGPFHRGVARLRGVRGSLRGVLVNAVRPRGGAGYGYGYAYGYGYGYGYGRKYGERYGTDRRPEAEGAAPASAAPAANGSSKNGHRAQEPRETRARATVRVLEAPAARPPA
jgi:capsular exopolysaccharide synthesis family protein